MNTKLQLIFACNFNVAASAAVSVSVALYVWPTYSSCKNSITEKKKRKINWETALDAAKIDKRDTDTDTQSNQKRGKPRFLLGMPFAQLGVGARATWRETETETKFQGGVTQTHSLAPISMPISHLRGRIFETWVELATLLRQSTPLVPRPFHPVLGVLVSFCTQRHRRWHRRRCVCVRDAIKMLLITQ